MMETLNFNPSDYLPRGYYPWPDLINPHVDQLRNEVHDWYDNDYTDWLIKEQKEKYKRQELEDCICRMSPKTDYDSLKTFAIWFVLATVWDDQFEYTSIEEFEHLQQRIVDVFYGKTINSEHSGPDRLVALMRDIMRRQRVPQEWMDRVMDDNNRYILYGEREEVAFRKELRYPPSATYLITREHSIALHVCFNWSELGAGFILPQRLAEHPFLQRLRRLGARICVLMNDIHSLRKEMGKEMEGILNMVRVLQHERNLSVEDACIETKRIHDDLLSTFVIMQNNVPDFGVYNDGVKAYILDMGMMIQGLNTYYHISANTRYANNGAGFAWRESKLVQ